MRAAVLTEPQSIRIEERDEPGPDADEVVVDMSEVGICGSDVHYYEHGRIGDFVVEGPLILGHESAGVVSEVGEDVTGLEAGDRVSLEPGYPCRRCEHCRRGEYHLCSDITFMATPPDDGAFVESIAWPADYVFELPDDVSLREGAMAEPVSVGVHACRHAGVSAGDSVLVTGAGPIGLFTADVARAMGATTTIVTDLVDSKRERALERGADMAVNPAEEEVHRAVGQRVDGDGVDVAVEATGSPQALAGAIEAVRPGGTVVAVGLGDEAELPLDVVDLISREVTLKGSFRYSNTYPAAIELLADGAIDVPSVVDFELPLDRVEEGMNRAQDPDAVKGMITFGE